MTETNEKVVPILTTTDKNHAIVPNSTIDEKVLHELFNKLDLDKDGQLTSAEVQKALFRLGLPSSEKYVRDVMESIKVVGTASNHNHRHPATTAVTPTEEIHNISYDEFRIFVVNKYKQLYQLFAEFDENGDGLIDASEVKRMLEKMGMMDQTDERNVNRLVRLLDRNQSGGIDFEEWSELLMMIPIANVHSLLEYWKEAAVFDIDDGVPPPPPQSKGTKALIHLTAGAIAGAASRTGTAPLERLKILFQINTGKPPTIVEGLRTMYRDGGIKGLWRGNGVNCLKIAPETAVKFLTFEAVKRTFSENDSDLTSFQLFVAGASAGVAAHSCFFPLEVIKTRLSASHSTVSVTQLVSDIVKNEGKFFPFYRGLSVSLASTIPHSGFNLMAYETCKRLIVGEDPEPDQNNVVGLMAAGMTSSTLSQFVFYPLHTIKARLIIKNHSDMEPTRNYNGVFDVVRKTYQKEGSRGFYKGFLPSFLKSVPAHGILYASFEVLKRTLGIEKAHKHHHHHH